jgi:hypothetical protein
LWSKLQWTLITVERERCRVKLREGGVKELREREREIFWNRKG